MRHIFFITLFSCLFFSVQAQMTNEKIHPDLQVLIDADPEAYHNVFIILEDRVDAAELERQFNANNTPKAERVKTLIPLLQEKADQTQPPIVAMLEESEWVDPNSIETLWITNAIFFSAHRNMIEQLARMDEVALIQDNWKAKIVGYEEELSAPAPATSVAAEQGLKAINADAMWDLGYTGYGTKAMIIDTGGDENHPALKSQYWGQWVPHDEAWSGQGDPEPCTQVNGQLDNHGIHVTGTIVGLDRLQHDTIGVAFDAHWIGGGVNLGGSTPGDACDGFSGGSVLSIGQTFQWALNPDGNIGTSDDIPNVINNSWGGGTSSDLCNGYPSFSLITANALYAVGVAMTFSAGNSGPSSGTVTAPAFIAEDLVKVFSVGNIDANNPSWPISSSSSRGPTPCAPGSTSSLAIKPEVSAPGSAIRSASTNGDYALLWGTSMASPHVAGAILLLQEAFPDLVGTDIMLALYNSCIDLGPTGEDNTYGMGMIDVKAAYDYLIDQGHTPTPPVSRANDVIILDARSSNNNCNNELALTVHFENGGQNTLTSLNINYTLSGASSTDGTVTWEGSLEPGERIEYTATPITGVAAGSYEVVVELSDPNGLEDVRFLNNRLSTTAIVTDAQLIDVEIEGNADVVCENSTVTLRALKDGPGFVRWYDQSTGGDLLATGDVYTVSDIQNPTEVYAQMVRRENVGEPNTDDGFEWDDDGEGVLIFDAYSPFTLKTIRVFSEDSGNRFIGVRTKGGSIIDSKSVSVPDAGEHVVEVDFDIPIGEDFELVQIAGKPLLHMINGTDYPYTIDNVVSIKTSSDGDNRYFYFFDWEIEYADFCGRKAVSVVPEPGGVVPFATFTVSNTDVTLEDGEAEVEFFGSADNADTYYWNFGDGTTSTELNPVHTYTEPGVYHVSFVATSADGCTDAISDVITVEEESIISSQQAVVLNTEKVLIFPNPTTGNLFVEFDVDQAQDVQISLLNTTGQLLKSWNQNVTDGEQTQLDIRQVTDGVYILMIDMEGQRVVKKVSVVKSN